MAIPWAAGLPWALPLASFPILRRRTPDVTNVPPIGGVPISVIVPARNESATIGTLTRSLLASEYHPFEIIVVDDRSSDDTRAQLSRFARADPRVRIIDGTELPPGWLGKPWACAQGAAAATGTLLVFTDADTVHAPGLLGHVAAAMTADDVDLFTLMSHQQCVTFWERIVQPQVFFILLLRYHPARVNRARRTGQAIANGQFLAVRRDTYERLGGHGAVRGEVVEDLAMAQHFVRNGARLRLMFSGLLLTTRMYRSLADIIEGWSKNLYIGSRRSAPDSTLLRALAPAGLIAGFVVWLMPWLALLLPSLRTAAAVAIAASLASWCAIYFAMDLPLVYAAGYPLGAATALWIALRSTLRGQRRIEWRGRIYRAPAD